MRKNILIVEDESIVALEISNYAQELGYNVIKYVSNSLDALAVVDRHDIDLILMDVHIKGDNDGVTCAEAIKKIKDIPIIYISAFSDDITLQRAILTHPNAYLVKPFNLKELKVAMSIATNQYNESLRVGNIIFDHEFSFDTQKDELLYIGNVVHLTRLEQKLLKLLLNNMNNTISLYELENDIWPDKGSNENTRRSLIARLRSKLKHRFLQTQQGIGYTLNL